MALSFGEINQTYVDGTIEFLNKTDRYGYRPSKNSLLRRAAILAAENLLTEWSNKPINDFPDSEIFKAKFPGRELKVAKDSYQYQWLNILKEALNDALISVQTREKFLFRPVVFCQRFNGFINHTQIYGVANPFVLNDQSQLISNKRKYTAELQIATTAALFNGLANTFMHHSDAVSNNGVLRINLDYVEVYCGIKEYVQKVFKVNNEETLESLLYRNSPLYMAMVEEYGKENLSLPQKLMLLNTSPSYALLIESLNKGKNITPLLEYSVS